MTQSNTRERCFYLPLDPLSDPNSYVTLQNSRIVACYVPLVKELTYTSRDERIIERSLKKMLRPEFYPLCMSWSDTDVIDVVISDERDLAMRDCDDECDYSMNIHRGHGKKGFWIGLPIVCLRSENDWQFLVFDIAKLDPGPILLENLLRRAMSPYMPGNKWVASTCDAGKVLVVRFDKKLNIKAVAIAINKVLKELKNE